MVDAHQKKYILSRMNSQLVPILIKNVPVEDRDLMRAYAKRKYRTVSRCLRHSIKQLAVREAKHRKKAA